MQVTRKMTTFAPASDKTMTEEVLRTLLESGEGVTIEYKTSKDKVSSSVYESVCSFLNRSGGTILLGVEDNGRVLGVTPDRANALIKDIVNSIQNYCCPLKVFLQDKN